LRMDPGVFHLPGAEKRCEVCKVNSRFPVKSITLGGRNRRPDLLEDYPRRTAFPKAFDGRREKRGLVHQKGKNA